MNWKRSIVVTAILLLSCKLFAVEPAKFYAVFSGNSASDINEMITSLEKEETSSLINAYKGALYMKQSSFMKEAKQKIETFKKGRTLLETEINNQPDNAEYRFLRLVVQEKSPPILKYKKDITSDKDLLISHFSELDSFVQKQVINYSRQSKKLDENELQ